MYGMAQQYEWWCVSSGILLVSYIGIIVIESAQSEYVHTVH